MKKIVLVAALCSNLLFAYAPYSSELEDEINAAFMEYDQFIQEQNQLLKQRYQNLKQTTIKDILQEHKTKELHLRHITIMNVDESIDEGSINYEFGRFKHLKDKQGEE